jgi:hypothetical protein
VDCPCQFLNDTEHQLHRGSSRRRVSRKFLQSFNNKLAYQKNVADPDQSGSVIFDYIEVLYNRQRLHQTLDYQSRVYYKMTHIV